MAMQDAGQWTKMLDGCQVGFSEEIPWSFSHHLFSHCPSTSLFCLQFPVK